MTHLFRKIIFALLFLGVQAYIKDTKAQNLITANPAEMYDFRSAFVNPAIISFHEAHVAVGGKIFHLGFVDNQSNPFRQGYVSLSLPFGISNLMGLGLQAQYFNTPLFSQSNLSFSLARRFRRIFSFGLKLNLFSKSFNQDNFDLVDPNDPVFANGTTKWSATLGVGFAVIPFPNLTIGLGLDHINRADISLASDNVYQPLKTYLGALWDIGPIRASVSASYEDGKFLPKTSIGTFAPQLGYLQVGYNNRAAQFEGQLRITGPLSLNYNYEYTLFDNQGIGHGSHQVTLIHNFDRKRKLPELKLPTEFMLTFQPPEKRMEFESTFYVYPTVSELEIIEKKLKRIIDPQIEQEILSNLSLYDLGVLDTSRAENLLPFERDTVEIVEIPAAQEANLSKDYQSFIKNFSEGLKEKKVLKANIISPVQSILRAAGLKQQFADDSSNINILMILEPVTKSSNDSLAAEKAGAPWVNPEESLTRLSHNSTKFQIVPVFIERYVKEWQLVIENSNNQIITRFQGKGMPAEELEWDWTDTQGKLIPPGIYYYYLQWRDHNGNTHASKKKTIHVQKLLRNITIEITQKPKNIGDDIDEIDILLKK